MDFSTSISDDVFTALSQSSYHNSISSAAKLTKTRTSIISSQNSTTILTRLWSRKLIRGERRKELSKPEASTLSASDFQTSSSSTSNSSGQTTLAFTTVGVYLPGNLQVSGTAAYVKTKEIAQGGEGSVWIATAVDPVLMEFGETVVVKIPNAKQMNDRAIALFHQEIALMNAFKQNHNVAKLIGYSENPYSTILEYYARGSLSKWITTSNRSLRQSHAFMNDISCGISLLHFNGIVHCDLKPDNVLIDLDSRLYAVITDFGISRIVKDNLLKVGAYQVQVIKGASIAYAAPEAIKELHGEQKDQHPKEVMSRDVYAIGVIFWAILNGRNAWK
eukprot:Partr_v1_DN24682_c0_g1_i2_m59656 putative protein kinase kinase kinase